MMYTWNQLLGVTPFPKGNGNRRSLVPLCSAKGPQENAGLLTSDLTISATLPNSAMRPPTHQRTIVELFETTVYAENGQPPDGVSACRSRAGLFSSLRRARVWLDRTVAASTDNDGCMVLRYFTATVIALDKTSGHGINIVFDGNGKYRGAFSGTGEEPFLGRTESECLYCPGDMVSLIYDEHYRIGIILARPPSPDETKAWNIRASGCPITRGDDVYLVGLLNPRGPDSDDHDHVPECLLWRAPATLNPQLVIALRTRNERYATSAGQT